MNPISFFASGEPKGQPRARAFAFRGKAGSKPQIRMYDPSTAEGWKSCIAMAARPFLPAAPIDFPVSLDCVFVMPRPKGHYGSGKNAGTLKAGAPTWFCGKPDRDNLDKAVLDALTTLGMWRDDCLVVSGKISKRYQRDHSEPTGAHIAIAAASATENAA